MGGHEQIGALLVSVEKVTYLTNRCSIYQYLYKSGTTPERALDNLYAALVELYATILRLIALANRLFSKNVTTQTLYALINPSEVSDYIATFQDLEMRVEIEAQNCERMRSQEVDAKSKKLLESLHSPILRIDERVSSLLETVGDEEHLKILDWISEVLYGKHHETVKE